MAVSGIQEIGFLNIIIDPQEFIGDTPGSSIFQA